MTGLSKGAEQDDSGEGTTAAAAFLLGGWILLPASLQAFGGNSRLERGGEGTPLPCSPVDPAEFAEPPAGIAARFPPHQEESPRHEQRRDGPYSSGQDPHARRTRSHRPAGP